MTGKSDALLAVVQESCKEVCIKHIDDNFPTWEAGILHVLIRLLGPCGICILHKAKSTKSLGHIERQ